MKTVEINLYTIDELKTINKKAYEKVLSNEKSKKEILNILNKMRY